MSQATSTIVTGQQCPECGARVESDATETVCGDCGLVLDDSPVDHGPDWRSFEGDDGDPRRASPGDRNLHDRGLGSEVGTGGEQSADARRLQKWQRRVKSGRKKDRGRGYATTEIQRLGSALDLGDSLTTQAKTLWRQVHEAGRMQGRDMDTVAAAAVYAVCRIHQRGITASDVADVARTDTQSLCRRYNDLNEEMGLEVPPPEPRTRIRVVASELDADQQTVKRAMWLCDRMEDHEVHRGKPSTLAAAVLYRAGDWTQETVGEAAGVTPAAIRNRLERVPTMGEL